MNDPLDIRQADARALELVLAVQALKHAEQFVGITRIESRAVVANENPPSRRRHLERNRFRFWPRREVPVNFTALEIRLTSTIRSRHGRPARVAAGGFSTRYSALSSPPEKSSRSPDQLGRD